MAYLKTSVIAEISFEEEGKNKHKGSVEKCRGLARHGGAHLHFQYSGSRSRGVMHILGQLELPSKTLSKANKQQRVREVEEAAMGRLEMTSSHVNCLKISEDFIFSPQGPKMNST